jgi:6-phosphogluconolactonase
MAAEIRVAEDLHAAAAEGADLFFWLAEDAIAQRGRCMVALSGGSTPQALHARLAAAPQMTRLREATEFFFGDERCVGPDDPESNYGMARASLFAPARIPEERVHRMPGEADPEDGARRYEGLIRDRFGAAESEWPRFDVIFLGLGDDGHTASLFPRAPQLHERQRAVVASQSPKGVKPRITFTVPLINQARAILMLVSGTGKARAVRTALEEASVPAEDCPAKLVRPVEGRMIWILDEPAAAGLQFSKQQVPSDEE